MAEINIKTGESECHYYKERLLYLEEGQKDSLIDSSRVLCCHGELKNNRGMVSGDSPSVVSPGPPPTRNPSAAEPPVTLPSLPRATFFRQKWLLRCLLYQRLTYTWICIIIYIYILHGYSLHISNIYYTYMFIIYVYICCISFMTRT